MTLRVSVVATERALSRPVHNARTTWAQRSGYIITLQGDDGLLGAGEATPLPGFSADGLDACREALQRFDPSGIPSRLDPGRSVFDELGSASASLRATPSAQAAVEGALLDLWARAAGKPAWAMLLEPAALGATPRPRVVAALLLGEPEQAVAQAERAQARGLRSFKLKIGRPGALDRELGAVREVRRALGDEVTLRLDANQSLSLAQARAYLPRFAEHDLELIEEPCAPNELAQLADLRLPLAVDESLAGIGDPGAHASALAACGVQALVLKPGLLGGVSVCRAWARVAQGLGAEVILSHAFEGPRGLALSAALALSIGSETRAHGLDLEGARLDHLNFSWFSGSEIQPWAEPGFADVEGA
jgi:o-succinylbenzoate synthase